ncbi:uncharacterized mitochondrial protein AtMg00810-like [Solanum verrucosum]|nr:uncharacterized mitochondrial protein AtMg00810-like [Solanum verrucosum]
MSEFSMKDLGLVNFFLGISISACKGGYFLNQSKYIHDLLNRTGLFSSKPINTLLSSKSLIASDTSPPFYDPSLYHSLIGGLQYLTFTRPDIAFSVSQVAQFMHSPLDIHFTAVKRILCYMCGSINHGLFILDGSIGSLTCYTDADWVASSVLQVRYVPSVDQLADLLMKSIPYAQFSFLRDKLNIYRDPALLEGE